MTKKDKKETITQSKDLRTIHNDANLGPIASGKVKELLRQKQGEMSTCGAEHKNRKIATDEKTKLRVESYDPPDQSLTTHNPGIEIRQAHSDRRKYNPNEKNTTYTRKKELPQAPKNRTNAEPTSGLEAQPP